jgi:hypothetical protein
MIAISKIVSAHHYPHHQTPPVFSLRKWCNIPEDRIKDEVARFENMILVEGAKLKAEGKNGLVKLPGVDELLKSVSLVPWALLDSEGV